VAPRNDKNSGEDRYSTKIIAREMQLLGGRGDGGGQSGGQNSGHGAQQQARPQQSAAPAAAPAVAAGAEFDDDIPF